MIEYIDPRIIYTEAPKTGLNDREKNVLRELASKVQHYAQDAKQDKKRELWYAHNSLQRVRPMVLVFPEGPGLRFCRGTIWCAEMNSTGHTNGCCAASVTGMNILTMIL